MKKYGFPLLLSALAFGIGASFYKLLEPNLSKELLSLMFRAILGVVFLIFTLKFVKTRNLFKFTKITKEQIGLILLLCILFVLNNYFLSTYSTKVSFLTNSNLSLVLLGFIVNSFFEEFAYRGFIQGYVNQNLSRIKSPISQGNVLASGIMLLTHLGFFVVMDTLFAITALVLVLLFSLSLGYIRDKGGSIWLLIIIHTLVNGIHILMNLEHYYPTT